MRIPTTTLAVWLALTFASTAAAAVSECQSDALMRAGKLLKLHWDEGDSRLADLPGTPGADGSLMAWSLDDAPVELLPIKAPVGEGLFDVLEVNGFVYKATYRMRFIYAQIPDACVLMGQEMIELADPY